MGSIGKTLPEVGIALAAFNPNETKLHSQIQTIADQTFESWVCIVSFDSDLPSPLISDSRFRWIKNPSPGGHAKNFEHAYRYCLDNFPSVRYIAFSDQDDLWFPNKIETLVNKIRTLPPLSGVHADMLLEIEQGNFISCWAYENRRLDNIRISDLAIHNVCTGASAMFDAALMRKHPAIPTGIKNHDHWFALLALNYGELTSIDIPLHRYIQHESNLIGATKPPILFSLRKNWHFTDLINDLCNCYANFEIISKSLKECSDGKGIKLGIKDVIITLTRALLERNHPLARSSLKVFLGKLLSLAKS